MKPGLAFTLALGTLCCASPAKLRLKSDRRADTMPTLTLPYSSYKASNYNPNGDVSLTHNVRSPVADIGHDRCIPSRTFVLLHHLSEIFDGRNPQLLKRRVKFKMVLMAQFVFKHPSKDLNCQDPDPVALTYFFHRSLIKVKVNFLPKMRHACANVGPRLSLSGYLRPCSGRRQSIAKTSSGLLVLWRRLHLWRQRFFRECAALL